jgi:hypothetical protein
VDYAGCTRILAKSGMADLKKLKVPLDTYYFCQNYKFNVQFLGQIDKSAGQNVANSKACAQQVKSSVVAHQADHDNGLLAMLNNKPQK